MRRLLLLVSALVFVDTMLFAALTPLLPHFAHAFALSKVRAGALVAAYAAGALVGGLPGGAAAARLGPRRAVLVGLASMGVASIGFAFAGSFWTLFAARFVQGAGSAFTWAGAFAWLIAAAPRERRGALLGTAMGAAVFGALFGPVIGAAAALVGRATIFSALAVVAVVLGAMTMQLEPTPTEHPSAAAIGRAFRTYRFAAGLALMSLPSLLFGILSVLGPLRLAAAGWGAAAIGGVWLAGAALETIGSPVAGRIVDARGRLLPVRVSLVLGTLVSLGLAAGPRPLFYAPLIVVAAAAYGILFTPAFALIADGAEAAGLPQGMAFGFMSAAWATGAFIGPGAAGAIAGATGDWFPFVLAAVCCAVTLVVTRGASKNERAAVLVDRLAGDAAGVGRE
ncbi:MAG TPA: MFS transporter [Gaiellaceae bacterium]|jgi:MFS family permease|nr:MFS transporter [Gaiellaceae bacterium]